MLTRGIYGKLGTVLFGLAWLAGCTSVPDAPVISPSPALPTVPVEAATQTTAPTAQPTSPADPTEAVIETCPSPYHTLDDPRDQYALDAYLDTALAALEVAEAITYTNRTDVTLDEMLLVVEPNRFPDAFQLREILVGGAAPGSYHLDAHKLTLQLSEPLPPGCSAEIGFTFGLALPEQAGIFGHLDNQIALANWYPFVPPYHPEWGWLLNAPGAYGEHLVFPYADYQVSLTLSSLEGDPQIAAPALAEQQDQTFHYRLEGARTFALAVVYGFNQLSQTDGGVTYTVYYQAVSKQTAQAALDTLVNAVDLYSELFGPYPYDILTMTELDLFDGMEFDAQFFLSKKWFSTYDGTPKNNLVLLAAHETAHNWWYSQVGNDQAYEPWLDEALCVYSELLYIQAYHPELENWWWNFRVYNFDPGGPVNVTIYDYVQYEYYRQAVYLRGAEFVQVVRDALGDGQFFTFLQAYLEAGQGKVMSTTDFFDVLATVNPEAAETLRVQFFGDG